MSRDDKKNYAHTWWTPERWIQWVFATFELPYFDPCPADWHESYGDYLERSWKGRYPIYCNHPGGRGNVAKWWGRCAKELEAGRDVIWCAFSVEQLRTMEPSPLDMPGWLVMPKKRLSFIWGGPDMDKREHGKPGKSPSNWTVFWSSVEPAETPDECRILRTGTGL